MKEKVLKALANPPKIFNVPYTLALINFVFWFLAFVVFMVVVLIFMNSVPMWTTLFFIAGLFISHIILAFFSKKDSQVAQIVLSRIRLSTNKIPRKLVV